MNSTIIKIFKKGTNFLALKTGKKLYRNGSMFGGVIAAIIAVGALASGIQNKRKRQRKQLAPNKKTLYK